MVMVLQISVMVALAIAGMTIIMTSQHKHNAQNKRFERSLWVAESGIQRVISGLRHNNDGVSWGMATTVPSPKGFYWFGDWIALNDDQGKKIGEYMVDFINRAEATNQRLRLRVRAKSFVENGAEDQYVERVIGVDLTKWTLDNFAIASDNQLGGARINGGSEIHGGIFTSGQLHLDSASTGIYSDYSNLHNTSGGPGVFQGYTPPVVAPKAEVFVFEDPSYTGTECNGCVKVNNSGLGTNSDPLTAIHTAENDTTIDPGVSGQPYTTGDGVVGNGEEDYVAEKIDHEMPEVEFPDTHKDSEFMQARLAEATANGNSVCGGTSLAPTGMILDAADVTCGTGLTYTAPSGGNDGRIAINGAVYVYGDLVIKGPVEYTGKGVIFVEGKSTLTGGLGPQVKADYPNDAAIGIVATDDMDISNGSGPDKNYAGSFYSNKALNLQKSNVFGNLFGREAVNMPTTGTRPTIYVHPLVRAQLGIPMPDFTRSIVTVSNWWEMSGTAARTNAN
ncbi:MAG: hypothetical protein CVV27_02255 [Candidatus Melainabacteria bacterium HGW-Melainabacteria-1]|nr:MAG: hypothetical protein CVV27_02255 [Candidatus Melainabacteria bacterium HGW-Melainabacteria-1]